MKYVFATAAIVLVIASVALYATFPDVQSDVAVIYWVTDANPAREEQVTLYHEWLVEHEIGETVMLRTPRDVQRLHDRSIPRPLLRAMRHGTPHGSLLWDDKLQPRTPDASDLPITTVVPRMELRLDTGNRAHSKQIIQSVSGVAGEAMDMNGHDLPFMVDMGVLADMTEAGERLGFSPSQTWPAIVPDITEEGRQYAFPCNVAVWMQWVNKQTFKRYGMDPPPQRWSFEEFERFGKKFVERANADRERQTVFLTNNVSLTSMHRSLGLSTFNETMTRCTLNDPRFVRVLKLKRKWMYEDHILPTASDKNAFDTASGYGGATLQLFNRGNYAMFRMGRWALIQLRRFNAEREAAGQPPLQLDNVEPPHGGFPNTEIHTRCAAVYVDGAPELAQFFLAYLASETYNRQIVRDADALPPNPQYTELPAFKRPPDHPTEWGVHESFAEAAEHIAIAVSASPFITPSETRRHTNNAVSGFMNDMLTAEQAAAKASARINETIQRTIEDNPTLRREYERRRAIQERIDRRRAEGKPVPADWIDNVFHRRYYREKGWLE